MPEAAGTRHRGRAWAAPLGALAHATKHGSEALLLADAGQHRLDGPGSQLFVAGRAVVSHEQEDDALPPPVLGEDEAIAASGIRVTSIAALTADELPAGPLYVHVDGDVVDPTDMPAMNYPAAEGPSLGAVIQAVRRLHDTGRVVAFSVSSWNPALPGAPIAAQAMRAMAAPFLPETGDQPSGRFS